LFVRAQSDLDADRAPYDLVLPLCVGTRTIGLWVADWRQDAEYREENLAYLEALMAQTATALENARLYALARRADELAFLNEVGLAANQNLDLHTTIESVISCVRATFNAAVVEICLWEDYGDPHRTFRWVQGEFQQSTRSLFGEDFVRRICEEYRLVNSATEAAIGVLGGADLTLCSVVGVALCFGEQEVGTLAVGSTAPHAYDREDARLLQVVGGQVATAIQNAQLFEEVELGRQVVLQSRNTLQALFDAILEGIYIVDRDKCALAINQTQAKWAGRPIKELIGQPAQLAFPESQHAMGLIEETFDTGEPALLTERQRDPQGGWTEWELQTYPVFVSERGSAGAAKIERQTDVVDRVVVVVRDVTEQRWLETSLARSEKLASIGRLAAGIAHEINNPMTVISANAQILREEIVSTHPYYGSVELIDRASERASRIVRNLLDFSRADEFEFVQTDLNLSLEEAVSLVGPQIRRSGVELSLELDPQLPLVWGSPDHLHVVWLNLLLNARDAIQESDRAGQIRVVSRLGKDQAVIQVHDNGVGIPPEEINRIYDPFFTTKPPGKGTGLGLFTCYRTVHRHGGEISVDSQVGVGTSFMVVLPLDSNGDP
jgi:two-component system NtrC family sensor kinase